MRHVRTVLLLVAGVMLIGMVPAFAETVDYPISVDQEVSACGGVKKDVVWVHFVEDNAPAEATLNDFMEKIVPDYALSEGKLPRPANVATLVTNVTVPTSGKVFILGQPATPAGFKRIDKRPILPVYLRVKINNMPDHQVCEDRHERFKGIVADPWKIESYFITAYSVIARVTKEHVCKPYPHVTKKIENGSYKKFNWVDP